MRASVIISGLLSSSIVNIHPSRLDVLKRNIGSVETFMPGDLPQNNIILLLRAAMAKTQSDYLVLISGQRDFVPKWQAMVFDAFLSNPKLAFIIDHEVVVVHRQFMARLVQNTYNDYDSFIRALIQDAGAIKADYLSDTLVLTKSMSKNNPDNRTQTGPVGSPPPDFIRPPETQPDDIPLIMIGCPSETGELQKGLVHSILAWSHDPSMKIMLMTPTRMHPLASARNFIVKEFLNSEANYLFWVDDDVIPPPETLRRLLSRDKDLIGPVCFSSKRDDNTGLLHPYPIVLRLNNDDEYEITDTTQEGEVVEIDSLGGGCVLIKRGVYENIDPPWYSFSFDDFGVMSRSADFNFFRLAQENGFKVFVDNTIGCDHITQSSLLATYNLMASLGMRNDIQR